MAACVALAPQAQDQAIFTFRTGFWLHLHHFLYVLGRAEARMPDRTRRAVEGAGAAQVTGLATATPEEAAAWRRAVTTYAAGLSRKDAVVDEAVWRVTTALAPLGEDAALPADPLPVEVKRALEDAAPVYRRVWWPEHGRQSRTFVDDLSDLAATRRGGHPGLRLLGLRRALAGRGLPGRGVVVCQLGRGVLHG